MAQWLLPTDAEVFSKQIFIFVRRKQPRSELWRYETWALLRLQKKELTADIVQWRLLSKSSILKLVSSASVDFSAIKPGTCLADAQIDVGMTTRGWRTKKTPAQIRRIVRLRYATFRHWANVLPIYRACVASVAEQVLKISLWKIQISKFREYFRSKCAVRAEVSRPVCGFDMLPDVGQVKTAAVL